jgi:prefoldin beta subunit
MQMVEQALASQTAQRSAYQAQLMEIENAERELAEAKESYRIIGNIMVKADPHKLKSELHDKKATIQARMSSVERQEQKLRAEMEQLQKQLLGGK